MKFECSRDDIAYAVSSAQKAVGTKSNVPLLEGVYIKASEDKVVIYGTDNEIGIECEFKADVRQPGEAVVNAKLFGDIIRNLTDESVYIETVDSGKIRITSGIYVYLIFIVQTDSFPSFPDVKRTAVYRIDQLTLKKMLSQTSFAIGTDETRKVLTGLLLESGNRELCAVAVDGYRIALRKHPVEPADNEIKMIIPSRTVSDLIKIIPSAMGELRLYGGENQAVIEFGNCKVFTRLINGDFFNYRYILPNEYMTQIRINRQKLLEAIEGAALIISSDLMRLYPVLLKVSGDILQVHALSESGVADMEIEIQMEGEPIDVAFNPRYFIETLRAVEDEIISIRFTTRVGQCVIRPVNNDGYTYLILPVKVGS
jgi:DNA polymerase-3 subunit beta